MCGLKILKGNRKQSVFVKKWYFFANTIESIGFLLYHNKRLNIFNSGYVFIAY